MRFIDCCRLARGSRELLGLLLCLGSLVCAPHLHAGPFDAWTRKMVISYPGYTGSTVLTNFPVLVKLSTDTPGFYYDDFYSPTGGDLRFSTSDGPRELTYEIDEWNPDGTSFVWVQIPAFTNNTTIHAYWRNAAETTAPSYATDGSTWTNGYVGVWHMKEADNLPVDSATVPRDNSCTNVVTDAVLADARVGKGISYQGYGLVALGNAADFSGLASATVSFWYYKRSRGGGDYGTVFGTGDHAWGMRHLNTDGLHARLNNVSAANTGDLADDAWHFVTFTYDSAAGRVNAYLNGLLTNSASTTLPWMNCTRLVGSGVLMDRAVNGILDEMRYSGVTRSGDWIRAAFLTTASNALFASYSAVDELDRDPELPLVHTHAVGGVTENSATLYGALVSTGSSPATVSVYWGPEDQGTNAFAWAHAIVFTGDPSLGVRATNVTALTSGMLYYYRYYAENAHGGIWSRAGVGFATDGPPLVGNLAESPKVAYSFLNGTLMTNGAVTYGHMYWGHTDGGTNASGWAHTNVLTEPVNGEFSSDTRPRVNWATGLSGIDIGAPGLAGSSFEANGAWTLTGSGADIYGASDKFHFVSRMADGDLDVHCRVGDFTGGTDPNRKAAIMLRQSLDANSRHVAVARTPTNGSSRIVFMRRTYEGNTTASEGTDGFTSAYYWARLVRQGNTYSGYRAADAGGAPGVWTQIGPSRTFVMNPEVNLGLAVTAHNDGELTTVAFDRFAGVVPGVGDLIYGQPYYFRCYATNAFGARWADETQLFVTAPPAGVAITNGTPSDVTVDSVTVNGTLMATGSVFDVSFLWGARDGGGIAEAWAHTNQVGSYTNLGTVALSATLDGLAQGTWYGTFLASNAATNMFAGPSEGFQPLGLPVISNQPVRNVSDSSATLNGYLTAGGAGEASVYYGMTDGRDDPAAWASTAVADSVVALRTIPAIVSGLKANGTHYYRWYVTNSTGADWADYSEIFVTDSAVVTLSDTVLDEGNGGSTTARFGVTLSTPSATPVSFDFATVDGAATAGSDYAATNGTLTIPAGQSSGWIDVQLIGDTLIESVLEDFLLIVDNPVDCTLAVTQAVCSIRDDDLGSIEKAWNYRMKITFSGYTGVETLTNFPVLVVFEQGRDGFDYGQFASGTGDDLRFTDASASVMLDHEIEAWDAGGKSYVWVRVPGLSGRETSIWAFWGNNDALALPAAAIGRTWGDEFLGVYHLHRDANDSTTNSNHGVDVNGPSRLAGVAGKGIDVAGGAHVNIGGESRWERIDNVHGDAFTLSAWVNPDTLGVDQTVIGRFGTQFLVWLDVGGGLVNHVIYDVGGPRTSESLGAAALLNQWQHVVATGDGVSMRIYVNGQFGSASTGDYDFAADTGSISLGSTAGGNGGRALDGSLDEARIAAVARSADWIMAEFLNVGSNRAFNTYSPAEATRPGTLLILR